MNTNANKTQDSVLTGIIIGSVLMGVVTVINAVSVDSNEVEFKVGQPAIMASKCDKNDGVDRIVFQTPWTPFRNLVTKGIAYCNNGGVFEHDFFKDDKK